MMRMPSKYLTLPFAAALVLAACDDKQPQQGAAKAPGGAAPAVEVTVSTLKAERVPLFTELPGRTTAYRVAEVRPQVGGIVQKRLFEEGTEVKAGQQLYQIDPASYQAAVQSALADLAKSRANLKSVEAKAARYADLVKINAVSRQDYDDAVATLDQAKAAIMVSDAAVATARINLEYTKVYAPISGRIGKSSVTEGALVTAGQTTAMATITQLDPIYVDVSQSSSDLLRLRQAVAAGKVNQSDADQAPVTLTLDGASQPYDQIGKLQFSEVTVDQSTGAVSLRAQFSNPRHELYPGLFVRARVEQGVRDNALLVPQRAVLRTNTGASTVLVVDAENKVVVRPITAVQASGDQWVVTDGVQPGERVIIEGIQKVKPGAQVRPVEAGAQPAAQPAAAAGQR